MSENDRYIEILFILFIIFLGFYYMFLASNTQMLGEDEGGYLKIAKEFTNLEYEKDIYVAYPLTPLIYSLAFLLFGYSLAVAKAVIAFFGILTLLMLYLFCKKIDETSFYGINIFGLASISIILTISYFTHFMLIAYTEIPMAFFSMLILYVLLELKNIKSAIFAGSVMGLAFYVKSTIPIIFPVALFLFALTKYFWKKDRQFLKIALIACVVSAVFMIPFILRNLILFDLPEIEGLNSFFKGNEAISPDWMTADIMKSLSISINPLSVFGFIAIFTSILGMVYLIQEKNEKMLFVFFLFALFMIVFFVRTAVGAGIGDPRYFSVLFPPIALIGGYITGKIVGIRKYLPMLLVLFFIFAVFTSITVAITTEQTQRYPSDYINALKWLSRNTNKDDLIFTAYGGSVDYFAERNSIWAIFMNDFPDLMHSTDSTYIYNTLKNYNVSYILVWRGVLSSDWIIPESNIIGVFTYNFVEQVQNDTEHFSLEYSNTNSQGQPDNFIYKLL